MGVWFTASTKPWFGDMTFRRGVALCDLSLSPLLLSEVTACWLLNMAALEASTADASRDSDGFVVSSYLSMLATLMGRKEDVRELRRLRLLHGTLSNKQALDLFKGLGQHLRFGGRYLATMEMIDSNASAKRRSGSGLRAHKFVYSKYSKIIGAFVSITGTVIAIFKILLSLKQDR